MRAILSKLEALERRIAPRLVRPSPRRILTVAQTPGGPDAIELEDAGEYARMLRGGAPAETNAERLAAAQARAAAEHVELRIIRIAHVRPDGVEDGGHYVNDASGPDGVSYIQHDGTRTRYSWGDAPLPSRPL